MLTWLTNISELVSNKKGQLGGRSSIARPENAYDPNSLRTGDVRFRFEARNVEEHGGFFAQLDQGRSTGQSLGSDAETGRGELHHQEVA